MHNNDKSVNQVLVTNDYGKFSYLNGNRDIKKPHLMRLRASIEEQLLQIPIIVNEKLQIIDGQHRYEIIRELGLPLYYTIMRGYGLPEVHRLNSLRKNWNSDDFMNAYADLGYKHYVKYREFKQKYRLDHNSCMMILGGQDSEDLIKIFHTGDFSVEDFDAACKEADKILMVEPFYAGARRRSFVRAMHKLFKNRAYNHALFLSKLKYQSTRLLDCVNTEQYIELIEEIYNYRLRDTVSFTRAVGCQAG